MRRLPQIFFLGAIALIGAISAYSIVRLLFVPWPLDPWEGGLVVEGWRTVQGLPLYEQLPAGHATHFHGALAPWLLGLVERVTGPSVQASRGVTLVSSLVVIAMLSWAANRHAPRARWLVVLGAGLLLGVHGETGQYLARGRPEMWALCAGTIGLFVLFHAERRASFMMYVLGAALLVLAMFFKQTAAVLSGIPFVAAALGRRRLPRRVMAMTFIAPAAIVLAVIFLRVFELAVFTGMIVSPTHYAIRISVILDEGARLLGGLALLWCIVVLRIWRGSERQPLGDIERWSVAAMLVTAGACSLAAGKSGAAANTWTPFWFAALFFVLLQLPWLLESLADVTRPFNRRLLEGALFAAACLFTFPSLHHGLYRLERYPEYATVGARVKNLPGQQVLFPLDNYLVLRTRGEFTRSFASELDANATKGEWPTRIPASMRAELDSARWVVLMEHGYSPLLNADSLARMGFARRETIGHFGIWERERATP